MKIVKRKKNLQKTQKHKSLIIIVMCKEVINEYNWHIQYLFFDLFWPRSDNICDRVLLGLIEEPRLIEATRGGINPWDGGPEDLVSIWERVGAFELVTVRFPLRLRGVATLGV